MTMNTKLSNIFAMTWSIEIRYNTIFLYDAYTYDICDMYIYDINYNVELFTLMYRNFPYHFVREMFEKLPRLLPVDTSSWKFGIPFGTLARQVGTPYGTLGRKNEKFGMLAR